MVIICKINKWTHQQWQIDLLKLLKRLRWLSRLRNRKSERESGHFHSERGKVKCAHRTRHVFEMFRSGFRWHICQVCCCPIIDAIEWEKKRLLSLSAFDWKRNSCMRKRIRNGWFIFLGTSRQSFNSNRVDCFCLCFAMYACFRVIMLLWICWVMCGCLVFIISSVLLLVLFFLREFVRTVRGPFVGKAKSLFKISTFHVGPGGARVCCC